MDTTTESQITSGKAESIDSPEFQKMLLDYAGSIFKSDMTSHHLAQSLIAHIEAVREKDREEARSGGWQDAWKASCKVGNPVAWAAQQGIKPDGDHLAALALSGALPEAQAEKVLRDTGVISTPSKDWCMKMARAEEEYGNAPPTIGSASTTDAATVRAKPLCYVRQSDIDNPIGSAIWAYRNPGQEWVVPMYTTPAQATPEGGPELPPLPPMKLTIADEPGRGHYYAADQMRDYARAALATTQRAAEKPMERAARTGEPEVFSFPTDDGRDEVRVVWPDGEVAMYRAAPPQQVDANSLPG